MENNRKDLEKVLNLRSTLERGIRSYADPTATTTVRRNEEGNFAIQIISDSLQALAPHLLPNEKYNGNKSQHCIEFVHRTIGDTAVMQPRVLVDPGTSPDELKGRNQDIECILEKYRTIYPGQTGQFAQSCPQITDQMPTSVSRYFSAPDAYETGQPIMYHLSAVPYPITLKLEGRQKLLHSATTFMEHYFDIPQDIDADFCQAGYDLQKALQHDMLTNKGIVLSIDLNNMKRQTARQDGKGEVIHYIFPLLNRSQANATHSTVRTTLELMYDAQGEPQHFIEKHIITHGQNEVVKQQAVERYMDHIRNHHFLADAHSCEGISSEPYNSHGIFLGTDSVMLKETRKVDGEESELIVRSIRDLYGLRAS